MSTHTFMDNITQRLAACRALGEGALDQLQPEDWHFSPTPESTSIAVIVKHLRGNLISRCTDFLTSDGNKPWRNRDGEFETNGSESPQELRAWWDEGWDLLLMTLKTLSDEDLLRIVTIRQQPLTVFSALFRHQGHLNYHVGQIVYLARMRRGSDWRSVSIEKGKSEDYIAKPTD